MSASETPTYTAVVLDRVVPTLGCGAKGNCCVPPLSGREEATTVGVGAAVVEVVLYHRSWSPPGLSWYMRSRCTVATELWGTESEADWLDRLASVSVRVIWYSVPDTWLALWISAPLAPRFGKGRER